MTKPAITVYITCHNYGRYLKQAIESVLAQTRQDWELIIVNDGSQDETLNLASQYQTKHPEKIRIINNTNARGLQFASNQALHEARGDYIIRLDADDFLDENILLVLAHYLDQHPDVALVYPNYVYIDSNGNYLGLEQRKKIEANKGSHLLDLPAHGAGTMVRKRILKSVGGYDEKYDRQDCYDLWLKVINRFPVANVTTPLFYYRQHKESLTRDEKRLLETRARIKHSHVERNGGTVTPRIVTIIGAKNTYTHLNNIVMTELLGRPLIDYTLDEVLEVKKLEAVVVTTDDKAVVDYCLQRYPDIHVRLRPSELSDDHVTGSLVVHEAVDFIEQKGVYPDIVISLNVHCPLRRAEHIRKAIDTLMLYNVDSVISVYEDSDLYYVHTDNGLEPLNPARHRQIRLEREALFVGNGAVRVLWRDILSKTDLSGRKVGHIVMPYYDSFRIKTTEDIKLIEHLLKQGGPDNAA
jgi:glycosyltransferase involved in cell wall biosynthesis